MARDGTVNREVTPYLSPTPLMSSLPLSQGRPCPESPYPQPWVQVQARVEQLIIIVIFVFPLTDNLMDGRGEANESWETGEK